MDYSELGVKIGLEIHQQLDTAKLFCPCPSILSEPIEGEKKFMRRLRATRSELGEIDGAAREAGEKKLVFQYQAPSHTCLVEADEEPPHPVNSEALDVALTVCAFIGAEATKELHFMRKIVIDGSNTSGFQRTALVAQRGTLKCSGGDVGIPTVCLEEDAARKMAQDGGTVTYRLDRLGIPLVEIATEPTIKTPQEAREVAQTIGYMLRATGKVKRGIGTIREDLNVSIREGARVEIKGVQELRLIPAYLEIEIARQVALIDVKQELARRAVVAIEPEIADCTDIMRTSQSKVIAGTVKGGGKILGIALKGFAGLLKNRLGPELAGYARTAGVKGLFHSDELPAYGITQAEVDALRTHFALGQQDAFAIVAERDDVARRALGMAIKRAQMALLGVPEETRDPLPDGRTTYSRPLPGKARMYPETDVPPMVISDGKMAAIRAALPLMPKERMAQLSQKYGVNTEQAEQLVMGGEDGTFEALALMHGTGTAPVIARTILSSIPELQKEGIAPERVTREILDGVFMTLKNGVFAKEGIPAVLAKCVRDGVGAQEAAKALDLAGGGADADVDAIIAKIISDNEKLVREKGEGAAGPLMGDAMKQLRGKVDGKVISHKLIEKIREALGAGK